MGKREEQAIKNLQKSCTTVDGAIDNVPEDNRKRIAFLQAINNLPPVKCKTDVAELEQRDRKSVV